MIIITPFKEIEINISEIFNKKNIASLYSHVSGHNDKIDISILKDKINKNKIQYIFIDRISTGLLKKEEGINNLTDDEFIEIFNDDEIKENIIGIIIFTFDILGNNSQLAFSPLKENIFSKFIGKKKPKVKIIETCNLIRLQNTDSHDEQELLRIVGDLIANSILAFIESSYRHKKEYDTQYVSNFEFLEYIDLLNRVYLNDNYQIGTVSFLSELHREYLLDTPYKSYYNELNNSLVNNEDLSNILRLENSSNLYNWACFEYQYSDKKLNIIRLFNNFENYNSEEDNKLIKNWLPFLHSGIFYDSDTWKKTIETNNGPLDSPHIKLFWFITHLSVEGIKGSINCTFYKYCNQDIEYNDIKMKADELYYTIFQLIQAKALNTLIKHLIENIKEETKSSTEARLIQKKFSEIESPLKTVIEDINKINSKILYIQRQINPEYIDFLNLPDEKRLFDLYKKNLVFAFKDQFGDSITAYGMHDFQLENLLKKENNSKLKRFVEGFKATIKEILNDAEIKPNNENIFNSSDILARIHNFLSDSLKNWEKNKKEAISIIILLKIVSLDAKSDYNQLYLIQMMFYLWVGNSSLDKKSSLRFKGESLEALLSYKDFLDKIENLTKSIEKYHELKTNPEFKGKYKLFNNVSPGRICVAIAQMCYDELRCDDNSSKVTVDSVSIIELESQVLAVVIECENQFRKDSSLRKRLNNKSDIEYTYHGLTSCFETIEEAIDEPRRFIDTKPESGLAIQNKFTIYSYEESIEIKKDKSKIKRPKTTISIILGAIDLFKNGITYGKIMEKK